MSLAELFGLNIEAAWFLFWTLFFVRLALGFAVGIDGIALSLRRPNAAAADKTERDADALRRANGVITALHVALIAVFVLVWPFLPAR